MTDKKLIMIGVVFAITFTTVWFIAMIAVPSFTSRNWNAVQALWHDWQSLNASMIVVLASFLVAITGYYFSLRDSQRAEERRKNNFRAYVARITSELNQITKRLEEDATELVKAYHQHTNTEATKMQFKDGFGDPSFDTSVITDCARFANDDQALLLTALVLRLQIYQARADWLVAQNQPLMKLAFTSAMFDVAELKVIVNRLFQLARAPNHGNYEPVDIEEIKNASHQLKFYPEELVLRDDDKVSMTCLDLWGHKVPKSISVEEEELRQRSYPQER